MTSLDYVLVNEQNTLQYFCQHTAPNEQFSICDVKQLVASSHPLCIFLSDTNLEGQEALDDLYNIVKKEYVNILLVELDRLAAPTFTWHLPNEISVYDLAQSNWKVCELNE